MIKTYASETVLMDDPRTVWSYVLGKYDLRCVLQEHINRGTATVSVVKNGEHLDGREFVMGGDHEAWFRLYDYAASAHEQHFEGAESGV
jgi:hypothetical protein